MKKILIPIAIAMLAIAPSCSESRQSANAATAEAAKTRKSSKKSKDRSDAKLPVVLDFYADWCGPCRQFKPVFEDAKKRYDGQLFFKSIDVDTEQAMAAQFGIQYLPTTVLLDAEGHEVARRSGYMDSKMFDSYLEQLLK